jgi:cell division protein FtsW
MTRESKILVLVMFILVAVGVIMIYSASAVYSQINYQNPAHFLWRHLISVVVGTIFFFICLTADPSFLRQHSRTLISLSIVLLLLVFAPFLGKTAGGARRWIQVFFFQFQPVEYVKLAVCIYLADYLSRKKQLISEGSISVFYPPLLLLTIIGLLVMAQPDLGSCVFLMFIAAILFFLSGIRMRYVILVGGLTAMAVIFLIAKAPYRMSRVAAYLNPWSDPQGSGFQIIQSFLAFGLGGVNGVGLGQSTQKLFYLPQSHTDFIFSIIAEELGLLGCYGVIALYVIFFYLGSHIVQKLRDPFVKLLGCSLVLIVILQALMNLAVAVGLVPTKGIPLPFISYGGSALVLHMGAVGILVSLDQSDQNRDDRKAVS